jgi:ferredoxin-type protein NapF
MANIDHSRRAFFRRPAALVASSSAAEEVNSENRWLPQRPPWALSESLFTDQCTRCNECISACEEDIIIKADGGFPEIDFNRGECTFCEACIEVCEPAALLKQVGEHANQQAFYFDITINDSCLAKQKVHCQSCKDVCDTSAITMPWPKDVSRGAIQTPEINIEDCTSCGACVSTCPSQSISINPIASPAASIKSAHDNKIGAQL